MGKARTITSMATEAFSPSFLEGLPQARAALMYAQNLHRGQRRESDEAPFILHPLEVAALLHNSGHREAVVAAGILHDTIEEAGATRESIGQRFGTEIAALVAAMTEDAGIEEFASRKAALREQIAAAGPDATSVYAADKVAKVRELRGRLAARPDLLETQARDRARLDHYRQSLITLEQITPDHPLVRQLRFELEALSALPPDDIRGTEPPDGPSGG
jgi:(p)ppGpp synthase/HD superfamily hydrolase